MKRSSLALVSYASSDEENEPEELASTPPQPPPTKRRKLPPVSTTIVAPDHVDDPSRHQGRIRSTPHVEGQFAAHVYVSLHLGRHGPMSRLYKVVQAVLRHAKEEVPALRDIWMTKADSSPPAAANGTGAAEEREKELHISLSRPIFLRAHQREEFKRAVKAVAKASKPFIASFATFSELINDEKTRTFLTMEIGAGYNELRSLADGLAPALQAIRQQVYYEEPRFHASIGWALLRSLQRTTVASQSTLPDDIPETSARELMSSSPSTLDLLQTTSDLSQFPAIPCIPAQLISDLNKRYGPEISSSKIGTFSIESIVLRIGNNVNVWKLGCGCL